MELMEAPAVIGQLPSKRRSAALAGVKLKTPNSESMSTDILGEITTEATYFLSCHMTVAQKKKYQSQKVMFEDLLK